METDQQNLVKSIIYGNMTQGGYGLMRALCSAITAKDHIDKIILFLRSNQNFQKYNRFVYAFRLQLPQNPLFITQQASNLPKFLQGFNDDQGLQGTGQKLLSLLQKFNVRNVLVIVAIRQKDSLKQLSAQHYVQIVKCAKDLLSTLYDKVVLGKSEQTPQETFQKVPLQPKEYLIPIEGPKIVEKPKPNPNYVGQMHVRHYEQRNLRQQKQPQIEFLNDKIKQLAGHLQQIIDKFGESEDAQARFALKYDKNKKVIKVFTLLARLFQFKDREQLMTDNLSNFLRSITTRNLTPSTIRALNQQLMSDRTLKPQLLVKQSKISSMIMEFLQALLKSYAFAKKLAVIQSQIQGEEQGEQDLDSQQQVQ